MNTIKNFLLISLSIICLVGCDAATKRIAKDELKGKYFQSFAGGHVQFVYVENSGGMLSLGNQLSEKSKFWVFTVGVSVIVVLLFGYTIFKRGLSKSIIFCFILFISGGIGNLLDRITNNGHVIDFILIEVLELRTGIFNLADLYITSGIFTLLIAELFLARKKKVEIGNQEKEHENNF